MANIAGWVEVSYTIDTADKHDWPEQMMRVYFHNIKRPAKKGEWTCADGALITEAVAAPALVPGLDFLAWLALGALGVSATCDGIEHAV